MSLKAFLHLAIGIFILIMVAPFSSPYHPLLFTLDTDLSVFTLLPGTPWKFHIPRFIVDLLLTLVVMGLIGINRVLRNEIIIRLKAQEKGGRIIFTGFLLLLSIAIGSTIPSTLVLYSLLLGSIGSYITILGLYHSQIPDYILSLTSKIPAQKHIFMASLLFFLSAHMISYFAFDHITYNPDSIAELFHAKILAAGAFTAPAPPAPQLFEHQIMMIRDGKWLSPYPPGHLLPLALFSLLGGPWLLTPLLGTCSVILIYCIAKRAWDEETAIVALYLSISSSFLLIFSSEFWNHTTTLFYILFFIFSYVSLKQNEKSIWFPALAGLALGLSACTRPLTALGISIPFILDALFSIPRSPRQRIIQYSILSISVLVCLGGLLLFNYETTGDMLVTGYELYGGVAHHPGFGVNSSGTYHGPSEALGNTIERVVMLQRYLFSWPIPSMVFIFFLVYSKRYRMWDRLFLLAAIGLLFAYAFFWYYDTHFGPRYMFEAIGLLILVSARGVRETFSALLKYETSRKLHSTLITMLIFMGCHSMIFGLRADIKRRWVFWKESTKSYYAIKDSPYKAGLFLVTGIYNTAILLNDPWLQGPQTVIRAPEDMDSLPKELLVYHRNVFIEDNDNAHGIRRVD